MRLTDPKVSDPAKESLVGKQGLKYIDQESQ